MEASGSTARLFLRCYEGVTRNRGGAPLRVRVSGYEQIAFIAPADARFSKEENLSVVGVNAALKMAKLKKKKIVTNHVKGLSLMFIRSSSFIMTAAASKSALFVFFMS